MFVKENTLNDKFCFFGWSLRIHYYCFMFRWKIWLTRSKLRCMAMEKRENSIKISFNFNHLIPYRIYVWLVSFLFLQKKKKSLSRRHDVSFTFIATIDHRRNRGMSNQKFTATKIIRITCKFAPKNWHKCIFKG